MYVSTDKMHPIMVQRLFHGPPIVDITTNGNKTSINPTLRSLIFLVDLIETKGLTRKENPPVHIFLIYFFINNSAYLFP